MNALQKVEQAGFSVELIDGRLSVTPASKLSSSQDEWIRSHRDELIRAVRLRDQELEASPPGHDHQAANDDHQSEPRVTLSQLPERLVNAVRRVCVEIHNDNDAAVQAMMEDLCWSDPRDWNKLIEHFESQLPPPPETALVPVPAVVMPHPVRITRQSSIVAWAWNPGLRPAAGGQRMNTLANYTPRVRHNAGGTCWRVPGHPMNRLSRGKTDEENSHTE
jgi:hypothetical protein